MNGPIVLNAKFQSILKFYKNIEIFGFNRYRWLLWSYIVMEKLKGIS